MLRQAGGCAGKATRGLCKPFVSPLRTYVRGLHEASCIICEEVPATDPRSLCKDGHEAHANPTQTLCEDGRDAWWGGARCMRKATAATTHAADGAYVSVNNIMMMMPKVVMKVADDDGGAIANA